MQLSTVDPSSEPWVVHVWYASTPSLDLIFVSRLTRVHSEHLRMRPPVAGGIIAIELERPGQKVQGVTFTGRAYECPSEECDDAYRAYAECWPQAHDLFPLAAIQAGDSMMRLYRVRPQAFVLFDEVNFPEEPKRVVSAW